MLREDLLGEDEEEEVEFPGIEHRYAGIVPAGVGLLVLEASIEEGLAIP